MIMKNGIELIAEERERQIVKEGWTSVHDDSNYSNYSAGDYPNANESPLYKAACCYQLLSRRDENNKPVGWPWDLKWWKPTPDNRIRELVKAGALFKAEYDRIQRYLDKHNLNSHVLLIKYQKDILVKIDECAAEIDRLNAENQTTI